MDKPNYFTKYSLSDNSLEKLKTIKNEKTNYDSKIRDAWLSISWEEPENTDAKEEYNEKDNNSTEVATSQSKPSQDCLPESTQATQYGFTQMDRQNSTFDIIATPIGNITDFLYESLERANGKLDMNSLKNIKVPELCIIINDLSKKLSHKGIYNLCHSICDMEIEFSERLISFVCKDVLLTTIISTEEPSRLMNAAITECVKKFPDDVKNFIFIPALNFEIKETTTILSITSNLDVQQKREYISGLSAEVKDLKQWHIAVLQDLITANNLDDNTREKVSNLLWKKSYEFSKDKSYGKLILHILKTNPPTTLQQKHLFEEIVTIHSTLFKKLIDKVLDGISII